MAAVVVRLFSAAVRDDRRGCAAVYRDAREARERVAIRDLRRSGCAGHSLRSQSGTLLLRAAAAPAAARQFLAAGVERDRGLRTDSVGVGVSTRRASAGR